jgi:hypothetical protein
MSNNIFEKASRLKLVFEVKTGVLFVSDLWELPLTSQTGKVNLDDMARELNEKLGEAKVSFVDKPARKNALLQLQFDIVKHIIKVRLKERDELAEASKKAERKQKIMEIIELKKDESLKGMSLEELKAALDE